MNRESLLKAVEFAAKVITGKPSLPILECVHLNGDGSRLTVTGCNLDLYARIEVESGLVIDLCTPAGRLKTLLSNFTGDEVEITETTITGPQKSPLKTLPGSEYPEILPVTGKRFVLPGEAISKVIMAASTDASRWTINSVYLDPKGFAVGTDGRRCHIFSIDPPATPANIPAAAAKLLSGATGEMRVKDGRFAVTGDGWEMGGKLIEGQFVNWQAAFPPDLPGVEISEEFTAEIQRAMACGGTDETGTQWIEVHPEHITAPDYESEVFVTGITEKLRCSPAYLLDAIKAAGEGATICAGGFDPIAIKNGKFKAVVLPMRMKK